MSKETQLIVRDWYQKNYDVVSSEVSLDIPIIEHLIERSSRVLNFGCYRGELEKLIGSRARLWLGVDYVPELIDLCNTYDITCVDFKLANITKMLFFGDEMWDVVLDMSAGAHLELEDFKLMLKEAYRLLVPDGHFVIAYYNFEKAGGVRSGFEYYGYYRKDTSLEMKTMLEETGFTICSTSEVGVRSHVIAKKIK